MPLDINLKRLAGLVVAGAAMVGLTAPANADITFGETITVHESILVEESPAAIWAEFGKFCDIPVWIGPVTSCVYDEGEGQLGTVRRINVEGLGELVEVMSVQGPTSYTYEIISAGILADAKYRSTVWAVPGPNPGTSEVHWRTTLLSAPFAEDNGVGIANALQDIYQSSLQTLKELVEF